VSEFETEPIPGLPEELPEGERILWQGAPRWQSLALRTFRVRMLGAYFAVLVLWRLVASITSGEGPLQVAIGTGILLAVAAGAMAVLAALAWLYARTTVYTITNRRLVMRFGIALSMSVNFPFRLIDSAALRSYGDGTGDIPLTLAAGERVAYAVLWPNARPWRFSQPQPMLRSVPDAQRAASILSTALAQAAGVPAQAIEPRDAPPSSAHHPRAFVDVAA
jgi:Bacterial PH domain